jgi:hypothetical protein
MADEEVESILREIRERVLATEVASASKMGQSNGNGAGDAAIAPENAGETAAADTLALIDSYLTTTARAWDRLPPLVSNRTGMPARLELWLKRHLKRATRWFTWEQVNFNAAVHHAISHNEQRVRTLRTEIRSAAETQRMELEKQQGEINKLEMAIRSAEARFSQHVSELLNELRVRDERLLDEQRVCFKQLSLETSETTVLEDRARRKTEALLAKLQRRIDQLEKK